MIGTTAKVKCSCKGQSAEFQDERYGKDIRVANFETKSEKSGLSQVTVRCTVCSTAHTVNKSQLS